MPNRLTGKVAAVRCVRVALACGIAVALSAHAQDQDAGSQKKNEQPKTLQTVIVTGTHQAGLSPTLSNSPIDVFSGNAIATQPSADMTTTLTKLVPSLSTLRYPIADATSFVRPVSLRGLSPDQTLVLVNGIRFHRSALVNLQLDPLGTTNQGAQAVDFSVFPSNAIQRVEVLRDGASVLYGSDAIAGVVNIILKDSRKGATVSADYGRYASGGGRNRRIDADAGFPIGATGFVHVSAEKEVSDPTSRGIPQGGAAAVAGVVGADLVPYHGFGQRWGDPYTNATKLFVNAGVPLGNDVTLYSYGNYMAKNIFSSFFYRNPVLPPQSGIAGRNTLVSYADGTLVPAFAPQSLVDSIIAGGGDPANYLTANPASQSGFELLNPIYTKFPGGYSPLFGADIADHQIVAGVRGGGETNLQWNVHYRIGSNEIDYRLTGSINPSLGDLSPTTFYPGRLTQRERGVGADFVRTFDNSPLTLSFGAQWRNETYIIQPGDPASWETGPTASVFGVGSDAFQGFAPATAGTFTHASSSAYFDAETNFTKKWSGSAAVRFEHASGFGSKVLYKASSRYAFTDTFAVRGTFNTGFRTPTPGQANTLNVTTTANAEGALIPSGTFPVDNPVAEALGSTPLRTETSKGVTAGVVWTPTSNLTATLDYYRIQVKNRIGLIGKVVTRDTVDKLLAENYPNAQLLLGSDASYFGNAFTSDVHGLDFVVDYEHRLLGGLLNTDFRMNYNRQKIADVQPNSIGPDFVYDLENQVPRSRATLTFDYTRGPIGVTARFNHYGAWRTADGLFGSGNPPLDAYTYSARTLLDLEARYQFTDVVSVAVGGTNVFNSFPDKEQNSTLRFLGVNYAVTSPFGFNGAFWYARLTAKF